MIFAAQEPELLLRCELQLHSVNSLNRFDQLDSEGPHGWEGGRGGEQQGQFVLM